MRRLVSPLDGIRSPFGPRFGTAFSPASLFSAGEQGAWYDPSDFSTMFQNSAGTTPVTAVEQPVGLILDESKGLVASTKGGKMDGVSGSGFDTPSAAANQITGDIDIRVQASLVSWTPSVITAFCSRLLTGASTADSYEFWISTSGVLQLLTVSGTTSTNVASSAAVGFTAGTTNWVRVTWQQSTGYVNFYTSSDGVTWTQNGTANRAGTTSATNAGSRLLRLGARIDNNFPLNGTIYRGQIYNGINGTLAVDFNPTLYTGGATFTAATGEVWTITGANARIVPNGNHATQSTSASRPVLSARVNLLTYSEQFDDAYWIKQAGTSVTVNQAVSPDGTTTADLVQSNGTNGIFSSSISGTGNVQTTKSIYLRGVSGGETVILQDASTSVGTTTCNLTTSWQRFTLTETVPTNNQLWVKNIPAGGIYIWGADLRVTNDTALPAYQRVNTSTDYDTTGFPYYLRFDGTDDSLATASIDPGAVDKAQVFSGVRKQSDVSTGTVVQLSSSTSTNNGTLGLYAPFNSGAAADYAFISKGTVRITVDSAAFVGPESAVLTAIGDIAGPTATLRRNGTQIATSSSSQGTGNFGSYALNLGTGAGLLNGRIYSLIVRFGANLDATTITNTETWVNQKTGAY
jgi:hypothetical protein